MKYENAPQVMKDMYFGPKIGEFGTRSDSQSISSMFFKFKKFWPEEADKIRANITNYPLVDLACGEYSNCLGTLNNLTVGLMADQPINYYFGVDRFNINDSSKYNLTRDFNERQYYSFNKELPENQPNLLENTFLYRSDMITFLKQLPSHSVKVISIGGFDNAICDLESPYRVELKKEIERILAPNAYFLDAESNLKLNKKSIRLIPKSDLINDDNYFSQLKLYKTDDSIPDNSNKLADKLQLLIYKSESIMKKFSIPIYDSLISEINYEDKNKNKFFDFINKNGVHFSNDRWDHSRDKINFQNLFKLVPEVNLKICQDIITNLFLRKNINTPKSISIYSEDLSDIFNLSKQPNIYPALKILKTIGYKPDIRYYGSVYRSARTITEIIKLIDNYGLEKISNIASSFFKSKQEYKNEDADHRLTLFREFYLSNLETTFRRVDLGKKDLPF